MSVLADATLRQRLMSSSIVVDPLADDAIQPSSIDVRLGTRLRVYRHSVMKRTTTDADWRDMILNGSRMWMLEPGHAYLGSTFERISVPNDLGCQLDGRSTVARMFVSLHQQAGWLDAGYEGRPTLEITVTLPVEVAPFDPVAQLIFHQMDRPAEHPYGDPSRHSRYQFDRDPMPAKVVAL